MHVSPCKRLLGVCRHTRLSVFLRCLRPSSPHFSRAVFLVALSFSFLLCPPHIFSLPILPLHLPQRPQIPSFSIYLQMRLLSCHLFRSPVLRFLSLLTEAANPSILLLFLRCKLVKTWEVLKSHDCFELHPRLSMQTCLTPPSKSAPAPLFHCCLSCPNAEKHQDGNLLIILDERRSSFINREDIYRHLHSIIDVKRSCFL